MTQGLSADKILYAFKLGSEPLTNKIHILGLQGATSGTNTKTLQSTATKTITLKMLGSANQQRVVDVIFTNENVPGYTENLYKILKDVGKMKKSLIFGELISTQFQEQLDHVQPVQNMHNAYCLTSQSQKVWQEF